MAKSALLPIYVNATLTDNVPHPLSLAAAFTTLPTNVTYQDCVTYQMNITTTDSTGSFFLQISNDYNKHTLTGNWVDVGTAGTVSATNDVAIVEMDPGSHTYTRLRYAPATAGTGTVSVIVSAKPLSGN